MKHANSILRFSNVTKRYSTTEDTIYALKEISFSLNKGESLALTGPSGSGKTTLLSLAAGLDKSDSGEIYFEDRPLHLLSEEERTALRLARSGFIFQSFRLLGSLTAIENVEVPAKLQGGKVTLQGAKDILSEVGLADRMHHYPSQLSGGEQQRVAIARAFITKPAILFADEPTGNLDLETALKIKDLIFNLQKEYCSSLLIVTHDSELASRADRILSIRGGVLI
jgi:putative ABC transport system ATP-binding protein